MNLLFNPKAPKKPTNVSINKDLLEKARSLKINLSATLEQTLAKKIAAAQQTKWKQENKAAIEEYNLFVEESGVFSDKLRKF